MAAVKFSKQYIHPNPIEVDYWVDLSKNPYGGVIKYYNGEDWVLLNNSGGSDSYFDFYTKELINKMLANKADVSSVESKVDDEELSEVIKNIEIKDVGDDTLHLVILKYDNDKIAVTIPTATATNPGILSGSDFVNFVKQHQLQELYTEMYDKLAEIRSKYQLKLKAGKNIKIDAATNTISATGKILLDYDDLINKPSIPSKTSELENDVPFATSSQVSQVQSVVNAEITRAITEEQRLASLIEDNTNTDNAQSTRISNLEKLISGGEVGDVDQSLVEIVGENTAAITQLLTDIDTKADKATTIEGYNIIDAYTKSNVDDIVSLYLPLSGGTISNIYDTLIIKRLSDIGSAYIKYDNNEGLLGTIGIGGSGATFPYEPYFQNKNGTAYKIYHSSNLTNLSQLTDDVVSGKYLPLSGGELSTSRFSVLTLKRNNNGTDSGIALTFANRNTNEICSIFAIESTRYLYRSDTLKNYKIWDEGNDGSGSGLDADLLDGKEYSDYGNVVKNETFDLNEVRDGFRAGKIFDATNAVTNTSKNRGFLEYGVNGHVAQFNSDQDNNLYYRWCENKYWKPWRTFAFTDSNVASATKLQTARTIWGQSFDGTTGISGDLFLGTYGSIVSIARTNSWASGFVVKDSSNTSKLCLFGLYGINDALKYAFIGKSHDDNWVRFLSSGNVLIGTTEDNGYKLDVNGAIRASSSLFVKDSITSGDYCDWYGVSWSENDSDPTCTRIGNMALHRSLPIQSAMKGYVIHNSKYELSANAMTPLSDDWSSVAYNLESNSTESNSNPATWSDSNIMVKIPEFWYTDDYEPSTKTHNLKISQTAKSGWQHHKEAYVSAYEGYDDGTYYRSVKGVIPTVNVTRETIRTKARANGYEDEYKWNIYTYEEHRAICHLFLVEYATRNSQAAVNTELTADGFKQGGLGSGCTTGYVTINGTTVYSFIPTGTTDNLGNGSGQVSYTVTQTDENGNEIDTVTRYANRYRGIENPFGHIWKHCDDVISQYANPHRTWYKCENPESFATNKNSKYKPICSRAVPSNGYKKEIAATINCDFFAESTGGSESTYWCDYNYDNTNTSEHCLLIGGCSGNGGAAGFFYLLSHYAVGNSGVDIGSRLTYLPWAE